jgi:hypothetical protein
MAHLPGSRGALVVVGSLSSPVSTISGAQRSVPNESPSSTSSASLTEAMVEKPAGVVINIYKIL